MFFFQKRILNKVSHQFVFEHPSSDNSYDKKKTSWIYERKTSGKQEKTNTEKKTAENQGTNFSKIC